MYMGIDLWSLSSMNTRLRFHACFEPSEPKPATPNREQRPTGRKDTPNTHTHTTLRRRREKKKKRTKTQPEREGKGGRRPRDPRPGQPTTDTTKPRNDTPRRCPPQKKPKGRGGGQTPPMATPAHAYAAGGPPESDGKRTQRAQEATRPSTQARRPGKPESKRNPAPHTNTEPPRQKWRGASGAHARTHTHPNTPTKKGGAQPKPEPSTHAHTAHPSQEWRGTRRARTQTHTSPNTPARSGGAQLQPRPKHTPPPRHPSKEVQGTRRDEDTNTHTTQHLP